MDADFDRLENETPRQKRFREDMEAAGLGDRVRTYSGRAMYGERTYGVTCYSGYRAREGAPSEQDVYGATKVRLSADTMGLGTILYVR